jgi:hypothetical protein
VLDTSDRIFCWNGQRKQLRDNIDVFKIKDQISLIKSNATLGEVHDRGNNTKEMGEGRE